MDEHTSSNGTGFGSYIAGLGLVAVGLLMALPVIVNLPDSWLGAVLAIVILAIGVWLIYAAGRARKEPPHPK